MFVFIQLKRERQIDHDPKCDVLFEKRKLEMGNILPIGLAAAWSNKITNHFILRDITSYSSFFHL